MDRDEHWEKTNKKEKINTDFRNELLKCNYSIILLVPKVDNEI